MFQVGSPLVQRTCLTPYQELKRRSAALASPKDLPKMRTNSTSSFGSPVNMDEIISASTSGSTLQVDDAQYLKKLNMYGKFFTMRLVQVLVQSRTNEKYSQPCVGAPGNPPDWFNIKIDELGEVTAQIKKTATKFPPEVSNLSIDFFLYTVDQETLPLESWTFSVDKSRSDEINPNEKVDIYHQLTTLLRSSIVASRVTPMHRYYVKKQSCDTFVILYKIISGSSEVDLGPDAKRVTLGAFPTIAGTFKLDLTYRTRMEIDRNYVPKSPETTESFQKVAFSPGTTPDSANIIGSPASFDAVSQMSGESSIQSPIASPPEGESDIGRVPINFQTARSRSSSVAESSASIATSPPTRGSPLSSSQNIAVSKSIPFANLLTMSYTGTLFTLHEDSNDHEKETAQSSEETQELAELGDLKLEPDALMEEISVAKSPIEAKSPVKPEHVEGADLSQSQNTVTDGEMTETVKPESGEESDGLQRDSFGFKSGSDDHLESDDDSFVKIPIFVAMNSESSSIDGSLGELITSCKSPPTLESFAEETFANVEAELEALSHNQGNFDRFLAEIRELCEREEID